MSSPIVSVVMVNYNRARFVAEAIQSVCVQTARDWELIVVENGSNDGSPEIVAALARTDPRLQLLPLPKRVPIPVAANIGIREARGEYVARLDSDDAWLPKFLACQLQSLERCGNQVGVSGVQIELIDMEGHHIGEKWFPLRHEDCVRAFWYRNPFCHSGVLIRRQCFIRFGLYNEDFTFSQDLELWMRLAQGFELQNLPQVLVRYRHWNGCVSMCQQRAQIDFALRARRLACREYGHSMGGGARLFFAITWCARWFPPQWTYWVFNQVYLKYACRFRATPCLHGLQQEKEEVEAIP